MITLQKTGNTLKFTFQNNGHYLTNGVIEAPVNSLTLFTDDSDMAVFKKSATNDVFIAALYSDFGMSKAQLISWFEANAVRDYGTTTGEVQSMTANYFDGAEYVSSAKTINFLHGTTVKATIDATDFIKDGMVDNVEIKDISGTSYLAITFNTDSGKQEIDIPMTSFFDASNYYTKQDIDAALSGKQDTLSAGTGISISGNVISSTGGGTTYTAGRGISIANNTISVSLPITAGTGQSSIMFGSHYNEANGEESLAEGNSTTANGECSHAEGIGCTTVGDGSHAEGSSTEANGDYSHTEGDSTIANGDYSHAEGGGTITNNNYEHASGKYNNSVMELGTFGNSGSTLFSVGNGTSENARHNALEIRQNGDIYIYYNNADTLLQTLLSGLDSRITALENNNT